MTAKVLPVGTEAGASGASINIHAGTVKKSAPVGTAVASRIVEQGKYMAKFGDVGFPRVLAVHEENGCYFMERLQEMPWYIVDYYALMMQLVIHLDRYVWGAVTDIKIDNTDWVEKHYAYITPRCKKWAPEHYDRLMMKFSLLKHDELRDTFIHGDPTFDNCMLRDGQLVTIDPIAPYDGIPSLTCVDMGKILQSAAGYERIRYGRPMPTLDMFQAMRVLNLDPVERDATLYFCAVHFIRLLPYQPEHLRPQFKETLRWVLSL